MPLAGVFLALVAAGIVPAHATCSRAGPTVICSGVANPLSPGYANSSSYLNVTVNPGASLGVLLGVGGTSMSLGGSGITVTNNGTIDPSALGTGLGVLSSGLIVGNASASTTTVINNGYLNGSTGVALSGVTGMALGAQNGTGGVTNITNTGVIGSNPLVGATLVGADAPVVMAYGGAQVNFNNSGTINGRVSFEASGTPGTGNTFVNSGTINGSVSLGANSTNTFTAVTGSSVNAAGGTGGALNVSVGVATLTFAATGTVDGGVGGNNTLILQDNGGPATGSINSGSYINFQHLDINSGTWTVSGASTYGDATLNGGVAVIDNNTSLGTGTITGNGGALEAAVAGINVSNTVTLGPAGLTLEGTNGITLSGTIGGSGALTQSGTGALTLTGANTYAGGTNLNSGSLIVGNDAALGTGPMTVSGSATLDSITSVSLGNSIAIDSGAVLTLGGSSNLALSGTISGAGGLTKNGPGTTTLSNVNTYTGGTTIDAGTLALGAGGSLAATGAVNLAASGASFDISAAGNQTIGALTGVAGSNVALGANTLTFGDATNQMFAGSIGGTGGLNKQGSGTQTLTGANTYTGGTTINGGTLALGAGGSLAAIGVVNLAGSGAGFDISAAGNQTISALSGVSGSNVTLGANTLTLSSSTNQIFAGSLSGSGGLTKQGSGTQTLSGANTYTGGTTINGGTLALGAGGSLAATGAVNLAASGASFDISAAGNQTIGALTGVAGSNVALGANTLTFGDATNQMFAGSIGGTGGLNKQGSGTQTLTGANTYTGGTTINGGTLALGAGGSLAAIGVVNLAGSGAGFDISAAGNQTIGALTGVAGSNVALGANTLTFGDATNQMFAGSIGGTGGLTKQGSGTQTLTGANTYTGGTTIKGGTLAIGQDASLGAVTGGLTLNGGTLQTTNTLNTLRNVTLAGNGGFETNAGTTLTLAGTVSGSGALVKTGSGTLTLSSTNTYAGGTTVNSGTLALESNQAAGTGAITLEGGTTLALANGLNVANALVIDGATTLAVASGTATESGSISGSGSYAISGAGTLLLTGDHSTFTGSVLLSGVTLNVGSNNALGSASVVLTGSAGLTYASGATIGNAISLASGTTLDANIATGNSATQSGGLSGAGALNVSGGGELTLTSTNTYTGATTIAGGTLALGGTGGIAQSGGVTDNGTFDISGTTNGASITNLIGSGKVSLGAQSLTLTNANGTFSGAIGGTGGVTVSGGTATLSGANTYTGTTAIASNSTVALSGTGSIAQSGSVANNGTLDISNTTSGATIQNLSGTGSVNIGSQTLTLASPSGTFAGTFDGTGKLVKQGSGSLVIDGDSSSFSGTTAVSGGLLEVGDIDNPQTVLGGSVSVDANATLRGHGTVLGNVTNSGTVAPGGSIGTLSVGGNYTQAGSATLSIEVSPTAASQLKVSGSATLNGVLAITYDPGTYTAKQYTIVSAANGVNGQFSSTTGTLTSGANLGALQSSVTYAANSVDLVLANASTTTTSTTTTTTTTPVIIAPTGTSIYTALGTAAMLNAQNTTAALLDRTGRASAATAGAPDGWVSVSGEQTKVGGSNSEPGFQANQYGFLAGLEQRLGDYTLGLAGGYTHTDLDEQATGDSGTIDTLRAALYASRWLGPVGVSGTLGYGLDFLSQKRPFAGVGTAGGDHVGQELTAGAQASLPLKLGSFVLTPRVGLRYAYFHANGFGESGAGGQDLQVGTDNVHSLQPYAELTLDKAFGDALKPMNVQVRVGYAHEVLDAGRVVNVTSYDGTLFAAPGTSLPRAYLTTGVSIGMHPAKNLTVSLGYDALINTTHASAQMGTVKAGYQF